MVCGRAEDTARDLAHREQYGLVVARSFGRPSLTAECAVGFLTATGRLAVTEPPERDETRWPSEALAELGLSPPEYRSGCAILARTGAPIDAWPRRRPASRPLW